MIFHKIIPISCLRAIFMQGSFLYSFFLTRISNDWKMHSSRDFLEMSRRHSLQCFVQTSSFTHNVSSKILKCFLLFKTNKNKLGLMSQQITCHIFNKLNKKITKCVSCSLCNVTSAPYFLEGNMKFYYIPCCWESEAEVDVCEIRSGWLYPLTSHNDLDHGVGHLKPSLTELDIWPCSS